MKTLEQYGEFKKLVEPLFEWLKENGNSYTKIIIDYQGASVTQHEFGISNLNFEKRKNR